MGTGGTGAGARWGCERLELPWEGHAQHFTPVMLQGNRMEGEACYPHLTAPREAHRELPEDPDALCRGCTQPSVRGGYCAPNSLLFFDLPPVFWFYEEP